MYYDNGKRKFLEHHCRDCIRDMKKNLRILLIIFISTCCVQLVLLFTISITTQNFIKEFLAELCRLMLVVGIIKIILLFFLLLINMIDLKRTKKNLKNYSK